MPTRRWMRGSLTLSGRATNLVWPHGPDWPHLLGLELSNLVFRYTVG
jgi:hypothetical protein